LTISLNIILCYWNMGLYKSFRRARVNDTFCASSRSIYDRRARDAQKIRSLAGTRRVLGATRTRVHASHGGAHGPENRREKVPKSARAGTIAQREERRRKRRQQQQQQQQQRRRQQQRWRQRWRERRGRRKRSRRKRAKGGPFVGGYRENEARHRVPHGPFSRHGARQRSQQSGPPSVGARRPGPCSRQRQRQARASHATRTRPSRLSREHKPRFFHPRRYLPLPPPHLLPPPPPPSPLLLTAVTAAFCRQTPSRISVLFSTSSFRYRDGSHSRWLCAFFPCFSLWYVRGFLARCRLLGGDHVHVAVIPVALLKNMKKRDMFETIFVNRSIYYRIEERWSSSIEEEKNEYYELFKIDIQKCFKKLTLSKQKAKMTNLILIKVKWQSEQSDYTRSSLL